MFQTTTTEYYLRQSVFDIHYILKSCPNMIPFISYGDAENIAINQFDRLFSCSTQ